MAKSSTYLAYLVRLWRDGSSKAWRATVKNPHTGEEQSFGTLHKLLRYLEAQTGEPWLPEEKEEEVGKCEW